jgi:hypothetical protein
MEFSRIPEIPDSLEHSERPLRTFVDIGYYESQVHTSSHYLICTGRFRPAPDSQLQSRKEIVAAAAVKATGLHATFLETAVQNRTDRDRLVRAFPEALCLRGRSYVRA